MSDVYEMFVSLLKVSELSYIVSTIRLIESEYFIVWNFDVYEIFCAKFRFLNHRNMMRMLNGSKIIGFSIYVLKNYLEYQKSLIID